MAPLTTAPWLLHLLAAAAAAACCAGTGTTTTPATAAAAAATAGGLASELRELAQLFQAGALDEPEFTAAKQAVINAAAAPPPPPPPPPHGPFNVVDFGADPSGKSDSTAAIQAAILAASKTYILRDCGNHGCGRSVADVYVPAGLYVLSATIELGIAPGIHGEGTAMLHQTNSSADIFYSSHVWRTQISGLHFLSGQNHLHLGTDNVDNSFIIVERCVFVNASSVAIRTVPPTGSYSNKTAYHGSASTLVTVSKCEFFDNEQVVVNYCDGFSLVDSWVQGCYKPTCSKGKALFENYDSLSIERMLGVPHPITGNDQRWIDNNHGMVIARNSRFGGEGGGFSVVLNRASFLSPNPPPRGALPPGTQWEGHPQGSTIILDACQIDSYGNKERDANIWLEEIPAIISVQNCQGFAFA
jgi:hypothetical protein